MKTIAHVIFDEKFFDDVIEVNEYITNNQYENEYLIVTWLGVKKRFKYIKRVKNIKFISALTFLFRAFRGDFDAVFLYSIKECPSTVISLIPKQIKVFWFAMGYDLYTYPECNPFIHVPNLVGPLTSKIKEPLAVRFKHIIKTILSLPLESLAYKAMHRTDYFSGILDYEYDLLKEKNDYKGGKVKFQYLSLDSFETREKKEDYIGDNILIGNSAAETNNHLEILQYLKKLNIGDRKIIVPLSYGGWKVQKQIIMESYEKEFHNQFVPILNFMPFADYKHIIGSCSIAIFGHERQQAMGNIKTALNMGCKVFLSNTSPVFTFLKKLGVYVYSIQNDLSTSEINTPLTEEEKSHNRNILYSMYNEKQFRSNFNYILSLF